MGVQDSAGRAPYAGLELVRLTVLIINRRTFATWTTACWPFESHLDVPFDEMVIDPNTAPKGPLFSKPWSQVLSMRNVANAPLAVDAFRRANT